jgi:DNA polymerase III subunit delta'
MAWQRVRGHEALAEAFGQVWRRGRLGHAYLFVGPPGIGKRLFALELAKALLCEGRPEGRLEACDRCPSCTLAEAGTHPDLFAVARPADGNELPIDVLRELCRNFAFKSARGRGKVAVLDDADDLNEAAANCFLKTLEEPPPRSVFILVGTSRDRQRLTIVSRCQVVPFAPLPDDAVADLLREQGVADPALLSRLTRLAGGSPGLGLTFSDPALWEFRAGLLEGLAQPQPDTVALARRWMRFLEEAGKETAAQRRRAHRVLRLLLADLGDALRINLGGRPRLAEPDQPGALGELAQRLTADDLLGLIDRCLEADEQVGRYIQLVLVVEGLLDALGQLIRERNLAQAVS